MSRNEHRAEAMQRIDASDYQWQEAPERAGVEPTLAAVLGSIREALIAQTHALLALSESAEMRPAPQDKVWLGGAS